MKKIRKYSANHSAARKILIKGGLNVPEKIITKVVDTAREVELDCRIRAEELFSLFTADIIKKEIVFYK